MLKNFSTFKPDYKGLVSARSQQQTFVAIALCKKSCPTVLFGKPLSNNHGRKRPLYGATALRRIARMLLQILLLML
jgi:hypothetical protein